MALIYCGFHILRANCSREDSFFSFALSPDKNGQRFWNEISDGQYRNGSPYHGFLAPVNLLLQGCGIIAVVRFP